MKMIFRMDYKMESGLEDHEKVNNEKEEDVC